MFITATGGTNIEITVAFKSLPGSFSLLTTHHYYLIAIAIVSSSRSSSILLNSTMYYRYIPPALRISLSSFDMGSNKP